MAIRKPRDVKRVNLWLATPVFDALAAWCKARGWDKQLGVSTLVKSGIGFKDPTLEQAIIYAARDKELDEKEALAKRERGEEDERRNAEIAETHRKLDEHWKFTKSFTNSRRECEEMSRSQMDGHVGWDSWVPPDDGWGDL